MFAANDVRRMTLPEYSFHKRISWRYLYAHRILDIIFGCCGLLLLSILFPFLALWIRLDSLGPALYRQQRVGLHGRLFWLYKFRSMECDAELDGPCWTQLHDRRITRVGSWLRASHLDELPQVINILRGDMSLIGPRPEREQFVTLLSQQFPLFSSRLLVRPGLTGWAQVCCPYADSIASTERKLRHDLDYIRLWSLHLDLLIIWKTLWTVLHFQGR